jgi:putative ABC transport system permease protein
MGGCRACYLLAPGADKKQVQAAFKERLTRVEFDDPENYKTMACLPMTRLEHLANDLLDLQPEETAPGRMALFALLAMLAFMGLPAINLVNVNLSRIYERSSEIGVRKAFGASGRDLVVQFVVENVFLSALGGLLALAAAFALLWVSTLFPQMPYTIFHLNWRIFLATLAVATVFGLLSGVWPAWKMSRQLPVAALKGGAS